MRERGSNTARPTEKGGGGLQIGARPVDFGASFLADSVDFGASFLADSVDFGASFLADSVGFGASFLADSVDFVAICRLPLGVSYRFGRFRRVVSCRHRRRHHADTEGDTMPTPKATPCRHRRRHQDTKKARFLNRGLGPQLSQGVARS